MLMSTGRGADVAKAVALPVFDGILIEPFTSFIVPTMYCVYMELKLNTGITDDLPKQNEVKEVSTSAFRRKLEGVN